MQHVRQCRYFINPNDGFRRQLQAFQRELTLKRAQEGGERHGEEEVKVATSVGQDNYSMFPASMSTTNVVRSNYIGNGFGVQAKPLFIQKSYT